MDAFIQRGVQLDSLIDAGENRLPEDALVILIVGHDETGGSKLSEVLKSYNVIKRFKHLYIMPTPCVYSEERKDFVDLTTIQNEFNGPSVSFNSMVCTMLLGELGMSTLGLGNPSDWGFRLKNCI